MSEDQRERLWYSLAQRIDGWLIPVAFGFLSVLVLAQVVTMIPAVRQHVDAVAGRFVQMPQDIVPATVTQEDAQITLYVSPGDAYSDIQVLQNGHPLPPLKGPSGQLTVREGDVISVNNPTQRLVIVSLDHNEPKLLLPAPGQTIYVDPGDSAQLPAVKFSH